MPELQAVVDAAGLRGQPARPMSVEQSNSSIMLGDVALVKVFRQLTPGINPDVEVHAALGSVGCTHVGRCLGWVNGGWREPASGQWVTGHLAMVQQLLSPPVDGWDLAREQVAAGASFAEDAHALGVATGAVHLDLRRALPTRTLERHGARSSWPTGCTGAWTRPSPWCPSSRPMSAALHERIRTLGHLGRPIARATRPRRLPPGPGAQGRRRLEAAGLRRRAGRRDGGPGRSRPSVARRRRDAPVVRLCRSAGRCRAWIPRRWPRGGSSCERAFLAGYAESGAADPEADADILAAYLVDKAAYEAAYEKRNRPDWLGIPLAALTDLAAPRG